MPIGFSDIIIFSAGGVVGYLGRQLLEHKLAIIRNFETIKATEFNKAASEFRAAFIDEIYLLRSSVKYGSKSAGNILIEGAFIKHEKAKIMFEPFLNGGDFRGFNAAWDNYRNYNLRYHEHKDNEDPGCGFSPTDINTIKEISEFCLVQIDNLLKFAEPKTST